MHALSICKRFGIIIALVLMTAGSAAAQAVHTPEETADNDLLLYYYNNPQPERLLGFLERYQKRANSWNAFPPAVGFYAVVFREHPDWIERLVPSRFDARSAAAIDAALRLSGQSAVRQSLQPRFPESGLDAKLQDELADLPSQITDIRIAKPTHLDILWGAFFASGDERYVRMIVDFLAQTADRSELVALDVARTVIAISSGQKQFYPPLKEKYGQALGMEIILAATAGWALGANARGHEKVADAMTIYISEHPGTPVTKVLSVLRARKSDSHP